MSKICIFDFDGTLADSIVSIAYFANKTMEEYGYGAIDSKTMMSFVGNGAKKQMERVIAYHNADVSIDEVLPNYLEKYRSNPSYLLEPFDGIKEMLDKLKAGGVKVSVLSNKPHNLTVSLLDTVFGKDYFYKPFGQMEGKKTKPDPSVVYEIIDGYEKDDCWMIGDSDVDIITGHNAGIHTIGVLWGYRPEEVIRSANPEFTVRTPDEIVSCLRGI